MELGFFTQPVHPASRSYAETLEEDREIFCLADRLGFSEAYCGEHLADQVENVPNSLMFIASLIGSTKNIRLGTGVHNLPFSHPLVVASNVAMVDTMLKGRFIFGVGAGIARPDAEALGLLEADRNAMFEEALEQVLAIWKEEPPYNLKGKYWNISTEKTRWPELGLGEVVRPFQRPHPPILAASADARSKRVVSFGRNGWWLMSSDTIPGSRLAEHWDGYVRGCVEGGRAADRSEWRVVRSIVVADDDKVADAYGKHAAESPYREHFSHFHRKFTRGRLLSCFKADPDIADEAVTLDYAIEHCVITGSVNKVVDQILALNEQSGSFGKLIYAGKNWTDPAISRRSMELMAEKVMPAVNASLGAKAA